MKVTGPLFKWFGSKWLASKLYPEPRHETIFEPFAGSAGYSLRRYGFVQHTWLWTKPFDNKSWSPWSLPNVLDVYVPGGMPQVQLIHMSASGLPPRYSLEPHGFDVSIRDDVVERLVQIFKESGLCPEEGSRGVS